MVTVQMPSATPHSSLHISGLLTGRNVVLMEHSDARGAPSGHNRKFVQERNLMNALNVVMPAVANYILFYGTKNT